MRQVLYVSAARPDLSDAEIDAVLLAARARNAELGVTGLLLEIDGGFLQILEGEPDVLHALMRAIGRDARHSGVTTLLEREVSARQFPNWAMGFRRSSARELPQTAFRITRAAIDDRLEPIGRDELAVLIDSFCAVNDRDLRDAKAA